jgi:hypothetical protein
LGEWGIDYGLISSFVCNKPKENGDKTKRSSSPHTSTPLPYRKNMNNEEKDEK